MIEEYYVPAIEDLFVGYECEVCTNYGYESFNDNKSIWLPITIGFKIDNIYTNQLLDIIFGIDDGYQPVRTLYLTKEQIEAEGWIYSHTLSDGPKKNKFIDFYTKNLDSDNKHYQLSISQDHQLSISLWRVIYSTYILYRGKCPSINEFRKICKLTL